MADCRALCIDPAQVAKFWPTVRHLIHRAMRRADLGSFAAVEDRVLSGDFLLWIAADGTDIPAAAVTALEATEWRTVCNVVACGGTDMSRWIGLLDQIETYAKAERCSAVRIVGREGWARVLRGYQTTRVVLERKL